MVKYLFLGVLFFSNIVIAAYFDTVKQGTTPWTISGAVNAKVYDISGVGLTSTQIEGKRALDVNAVGISANVSIGDNSASGAMNAVCADVDIDSCTGSSFIVLTTEGTSAVKSEITGTWVGTIKFDFSINGTNWHPAGVFSGTTGALLTVTGTTGNDSVVWVGVAGAKYLRSRFSSYTSGTANVLINASNGVSNVYANNLIPGNFRVQAFGSNTSLPIQVSGSGNILVDQGTNPWIISQPMAPTGVATGGNQVINYTYLASIDGKITSVSGAIYVTPRWEYRRQDAAATVTLKTGSGELKSACYTSPANGSTLTFYDNTSAAGTVIALISPLNGSTSHCLDFGGVHYFTGLTFVTTGTGDWTISYK